MPGASSGQFPSLTLQYDKILFLLEPNEIARESRRQRVTVVDYPDVRLAIRYRGLDLPYTTFDKLRPRDSGGMARTGQTAGHP